MFGCPVVTKKYTITTNTGTVNKNTTSQKGIRGIFIGFPPDQQGWLIYLPGSRRIAVSNDVTFDENFETSLSYQDKPFSDALPLRPVHTPKPLNDTVIEQTGDATNAPSSLEEGNNMITTPQNKNETDETVQVTNEVYDFEEGYHHLPFDSDEDDIPNHDQASDQEEEEPLNNDDLPQANGRPVRRTKQPSLLTFDFNSQDRKWTEVHKAYNAEVIEPLQEEANPQDEVDPIMYFPPPRSAIEMMRTKDSRKRNGWLKALKKELKNIIDNGTLDNTAKLEANEPVTMTMETN